MNEFIGLVNFHSSPDIHPITDNRPLGSTSFLGRYALCDFALSNFCNSGIQTVGLLVKDHQRSILKHLGSNTHWTKNTKTGHSIIMYNESAHADPRLNTDLNNIVENDWALYDSAAQYIIIAPAHVIAPIDYRPIIKEHIARGSSITVVATKIKDASKEFLSEDLIELGEDNNIYASYPNPGDVEGPAIASMATYIINRTVLADLIHRYLPANPCADIRTLVYQVIEEGKYPCRVYFYDGYVRCIDSYQKYVDVCFEVLNRRIAHQIFLPEWPIYTKSHDTAPSLYGENASISDSIIANGAVIEGTVQHSIIGRGVKIAKGAVVKNSIVFSNAKIGENSIVENALIDKLAIVTRGKRVIGEEGQEPLYVHQGAIL